MLHDLSDWLQTPLGCYVLDWEQACVDELIADIFGYNAVQLGMPTQAWLRASRIAHCLIAAPCAADSVAVRCEGFALPFASASMDLVVLPHFLESSLYPHDVLREVERVLVPEGSVIISGFNPFSLFGLRRMLARRSAEMPWRGAYYSAARVIDWLALLNIDADVEALGCYVPPIVSARWRQRFGFMDQGGPRWWPALGGVYVMHGVKRVHGMRLIQPKWRARRAARKGLVAVPSNQRGVTGRTHKIS